MLRMGRCLVSFLLLAPVLGIFSGCDDKEETKYAKAKVQFASEDSAALAGQAAPSLYEVVFHHFGISNPDAAEGSQGAIIWGNPKCATRFMNEKGQVIGDWKDDEECAAADPDYLDLARDAEEVNADLNSQEVWILPGTYSRISMAMLGSQQYGRNEFPNTSWTYDGQNYTFAAMITEWSGTIDPPVTVGEEERITITLNYSLDNIVSTGLTDAEEKVLGGGTIQPGKYDDCNEEGTVCINAPSITVTASK